MTEHHIGDNSAISLHVLETIAAVTAQEIKGITGLIGNKPRTLSRSHHSHHQGVSVEMNSHGQILVELRVTMAYGTNIRQVGKEAIQHLSDTICNMTGVRPHHIHIYVANITFTD